MADETSTNVPADASKRSATPAELPAELPAEASAQAGVSPARQSLDVGKAQAGVSSASSPQRATAASQPTSEPEARIIEETVVKPASPAKPPALPSAVDSIAFVPLEKPASPPPQPVSPQTPPLPPPPAPLASAIPLPIRTPAEFAKEQEAIANILKEIKLPERRMPESPPKESKAFDTTLGAVPREQIVPPKQEPAPAAAPNAASATPAGEPAKQGEGLASSIVSPLRTLKNDLQKIIRVKKISLVRAAALESQKRRGSAEEEREVVSAVRSRRSHGVLFAAALFVVLGGAAFFGVFLVMEERSPAPSVSPQSSILFAENGVPFPLDNTSSIDLKRLLAQARKGGGGTLGSITRIIPTASETTKEGVITERSATLEEFLRALGARVPEELFRALPDDFFFGLHTVDENAPLFVIPVLSYERAFAGMLRWEETMNADFSPVFTPLPDQVLGAGGLPEKRRFEDVVMRNYDVRVLKDNAGMIELYYSFLTRELLVIAESPYSFTEILSRLRAERKL